MGQKKRPSKSNVSTDAKIEKNAMSKIIQESYLQLYIQLYQESDERNSIKLGKREHAQSIRNSCYKISIYNAS